MGTILDLTKRSSHSYVDNPYWSVFQIRVKFLLHNIYVNKNFSHLQVQDAKRHRYHDQKWIEANIAKNANT